MLGKDELRDSVVDEVDILDTDIADYRGGGGEGKGLVAPLPPKPTSI